MPAKKKDTPTPSAQDLVNPSAVDVDRMAVQAEAEARAWIEVAGRSDKGSYGVWVGVPPGMEKWRFVRAGLKGSAKAESFAYRLRSMGYQWAPSTVRLMGYERDGDRGLYLCAPEAVAAAIKAEKKRKRKEHQAMLERQFQGKLTDVGPRANAEITHLGTGRATRDEIEGLLRKRS